MAADLDIVYVTHNRCAFTHESYKALLANTDWSLVHRLFLLDDQSSDGTLDFMREMSRNPPCNIHFASGDFGGPVAAFNHALDHSEAPLLAKIDNDLIVCPGWLEALLEVLSRDHLIDALGMEPGFAGPVVAADWPRRGRAARWIGGQGIFRTRAFQKARPEQSETYFGMTKFMRQRMRCAWVDPDLPVFNLDHLPGEPWRSLAALYVGEGWSRAWPPYSDAITSRYAGWWLEQQQQAVRA